MTEPNEEQAPFGWSYRVHLSRTPALIGAAHNRPEKFEVGEVVEVTDISGRPTGEYAIVEARWPSPFEGIPPLRPLPIRKKKAEG